MLPCKIRREITLGPWKLTLISKVDPNSKNMRAIILQKYGQVHTKCTISKIVSMIYFKIIVYDKKALANSASSYHCWDWNIVGTDHLFVCIFSCSKIGQRRNCKFNSYSNVFSKVGFTGRLNRLDHVDGSHHCIDRCTAGIIPAFDMDEITYRYSFHFQFLAMSIRSPSGGCE